VGLNTQFTHTRSMTNNAARIRLMSGRTFPRNADFTLCIRETFSVSQGGAQRYDSFSEFRERSGTGSRRPEWKARHTVSEWSGHSFIDCKRNHQLRQPSQLVATLNENFAQITAHVLAAESAGFVILSPSASSIAEDTSLGGPSSSPAHKQ
jgi:hypothetical protein